MQKSGSETGCAVCPRACYAVRREDKTGGYCGMPALPVVSRVAPHMWEEPPISGKRGSGTVFFAGCNLRCIFCQNKVISHGRQGRAVTEEELGDMILTLADTGVHNINLVTPTHYTPTLVRVLERVKPRLSIPVVWNSGGYESVESLQMLEGLVDVYLPDFKFFSPELADSYAGARDYPQVASDALLEMYRQVGGVVLDSEGMMQRGVMVRHLVLPGCRKDSIAVLRHLAGLLPVTTVRLSLMRQYTPTFAMDAPFKNLHRTLTEFEYGSVADEALALGFEGYFQGKDAADVAFTPKFSLLDT